MVSKTHSFHNKPFFRQLEVFKERFFPSILFLYAAKCQTVIISSLENKKYIFHQGLEPTRFDSTFKQQDNKINGLYIDML